MPDDPRKRKAIDEMLFGDKSVPNFLIPGANQVSGFSSVLPNDQIKERGNLPPANTPVQTSPVRKPDDDWQEVTPGEDDWQEVKPSAGVGLVESFIRGAGQSATANLEDEVRAAVMAPFVGQSYGTTRDQIRLANRKAKEENPNAYFAGEVAGALIPFGTAAKGVRLGKAAVMGALSGYGASEKETAAGQLFDTAVGGAGGAATQGLMSGVGGGVRFLGEKIRSKSQKIADKLNDLAEKRAVDAAGAMLADRRALRHQGILNKTGRALLDLGVVKPFTGLQKINRRASELAERAGEKIGSYEAILDEFRDLFEQHGFSGSLFNPSRVAARVKREVYDEIVTDPALGSNAKPILDIVNRLQDMGDKSLSFYDAGNIKRNFDKLLNWEKQGTPAKELIKKVRRIVNEEIETSFDTVSTKINPALNARWKKQKEIYRMMEKVKDISADKLERAEANRWISPSDYATGITGALLGSSSGPSGTVMGSLAAAGANRIARKYGSSVTAGAANSMSRFARSLPDRIAGGADVLNRVADSTLAPGLLGSKLSAGIVERARGTKYETALMNSGDVNVTHFLLMQTDPEYQRVMREKGE